nr:uncharacterized protein LOC120967117 [Aegilops tauschii subsp. strangulata]
MLSKFFKIFTFPSGGGVGSPMPATRWGFVVLTETDPELSRRTYINAREVFPPKSQSTDKITSTDANSGDSRRGYEESLRSAMAAAIRQAARRLAGFVLQRTKTEVPRRLIHGGPPAAAPSSLRHTSSGVEEIAVHQDGKASALREIKKKREELFDLIADTERRYDTRLTKEGCQNTRMLQQLAVQIEPRPNDPLWRSKRFSKRLNDFFWG